MNSKIATVLGMAIYECFVTLLVVLLWEVTLLLLSYSPITPLLAYMETSTSKIWYMTILSGLIFSAWIDWNQIYGTQSTEEVRTLPVYAVRIFTNYFLYGLFMSWIGLRYSLPDPIYPYGHSKYTLEMKASGFMGGLDLVCLDTINVTIGRFFITTIEAIGAVCYYIATTYAT